MSEPQEPSVSEIPTQYILRFLGQQNPSNPYNRSALVQNLAVEMTQQIFPLGHLLAQNESVAHSVGFAASIIQFSRVNGENDSSSAYNLYLRYVDMFNSNNPVGDNNVRFEVVPLTYNYFSNMFDLITEPIVTEWSSKE